MKLLKASDSPFDPSPDLYTDTEWQAACVVDRGAQVPDVKKRYAIPVREPNGPINTHALNKAAEQLAGPLDGLTDRQIEKAQAKLARRYEKAGLPARTDLAKAAVPGKARNDLPDTAFAYIEPGGTKDEDGKTAPRSKRHFLIHDAAHVRNALARIGQGAKFGKEALPKVKAAAGKFNVDVTKTDLEVSIPLWKDDSKQIVYGVVLTPGLLDSQGDIASADEIEKAAHRFLTEYRKHDVQHAEVTLGSGGEPIAETVESFIAPQDMDVAGQHVLKGSWVLGTKVHDPDTWQRVLKREITGYSIGGSGERVPLAA